MTHLKRAALMIALFAVSAGVSAKPAGYEIALGVSKGKVADLFDDGEAKSKGNLVAFTKVFNFGEESESQGTVFKNPNFKQGLVKNEKLEQTGKWLKFTSNKQQGTNTFDLFQVGGPGGVSDIVKELQENGQLGSSCAKGACANGGPFTQIGGGGTETPVPLPEPGTWFVLFAALSAMLFGARLRQARAR